MGYCAYRNGPVVAALLNNRILRRRNQERTVRPCQPRYPQRASVAASRHVLTSQLSRPGFKSILSKRHASRGQMAPRTLARRKQSIPATERQEPSVLPSSSVQSAKSLAKAWGGGAAGAYTASLHYLAAEIFVTAVTAIVLITGVILLAVMISAARRAAIGFSAFSAGSVAKKNRQHRPIHSPMPEEPGRTPKRYGFSERRPSLPAAGHACRFRLRSRLGSSFCSAGHYGDLVS